MENIVETLLRKQLTTTNNNSIVVRCIKLICLVLASSSFLGFLAGLY
jgi:hypothetical protein